LQLAALEIVSDYSPSEVAVEQLHVKVNRLENEQLVGSLRYARHEIERRVPPVNGVQSPLLVPDDRGRLVGPGDYCVLNGSNDSSSGCGGLGAPKHGKADSARAAEEDQIVEGRHEGRHEGRRRRRMREGERRGEGGGGGGKDTTGFWVKKR